jgi:hypothetical protein
MNIGKLDYMQDRRRQEVANKFGEPINFLNWGTSRRGNGAIENMN